MCANPDLVVDVGEQALPVRRQHRRRVRAPRRRRVLGRQAAPFGLRAASSAPAALRGAEPERARILAIGDAVRTDLAAAQGMGVDALFIASGIHNQDVLIDGAIDPAKLAALFAPPGTPPAIAAMTQLRW